ncbi:hypothetical protein [Streptomyces sp. NBC_00859]|uniref:hypothetical protein n=1 Tax=Streptomyces sp. NBC_00859 TaxID=2903682 RepID=UPI003866FC40|nr:hypothetical protein OG584_13980 [Streptomyces sp. NBC_00859]
MKHRHLPTTATLLTAAALLLSTCGGKSDGGSKGNNSDSPTTAAAARRTPSSASPGASVSPSASGSSGAVAGRPRIELPEDIKNTFDWPKTGDKDKDAVLSDSEEFIKSRDLAIAKQDPLDSAYRFYTEGEMAASTQEYVQDYVNHKARATGSVRYYEGHAVISDHNSATLSYCQDQGRGFDMDINSGKVHKTPVTKDSYVLYNAVLRKNARGVWVTTDLYSRRGSSNCRP